MLVNQANSTSVPSCLGKADIGRSSCRVLRGSLVERTDSNRPAAVLLDAPLLLNSSVCQHDLLGRLNLPRELWTPRCRWCWGWREHWRLRRFPGMQPPGTDLHTYFLCFLEKCGFLLGGSLMSVSPYPRADAWRTGFLSPGNDTSAVSNLHFQQFFIQRLYFRCWLLKSVGSIATHMTLNSLCDYPMILVGRFVLTNDW